MSDLARRRFQKLTAPLRKTDRHDERVQATDDTSANAAFSSSAGNAGSVDATVTVLEEVVRRHSRAASTFVGSSPTAAEAARPPAVSTRVVRIPAFTSRDSAGAAASEE
jgi:hypothetical protein